MIQFKPGDLVRPSKKFYTKAGIFHFNFALAEIIDGGSGNVTLSYFESLMPQFIAFIWSATYLELVYRDSI